MNKTVHNEFKYFYVVDSDGGCEQQTGRTVQKFDTLGEAVAAAKDDILYMLGGDENAVEDVVGTIMNFRPGADSRKIYSGEYSNGGDDDDWLHVDFCIVYTNAWSERTTYDV